jgi:oxalate decarboxylase/phosphoglucose isomerase-like protein (cupin superfamily)
MQSRKYSIFDCQILHLPKIHNRAGNITPIQNSIEVPFDIARVYYLYDVPGGESRGGHAHRELQQLIVAASGSFDAILDDGHNKKTVSLNRPNYGLYVPPGIWRDLSNFSSGAVLLVMASIKYSEDDYIRDYDDFSRFAKE